MTKIENNKIFKKFKCFETQMTYFFVGLISKRQDKPTVLTRKQNMKFLHYFYGAILAFMNPTKKRSLLFAQHKK
jgi:hypothetical protein